MRIWLMKYWIPLIMNTNIRELFNPVIKGEFTITNVG